MFCESTASYFHSIDLILSQFTLARARHGVGESPLAGSLRLFPAAMVGRDTPSLADRVSKVVALAWDAMAQLLVDSTGHAGPCEPTPGSPCRGSRTNAHANQRTVGFKDSQRRVPRRVFNSDFAQLRKQSPPWSTREPTGTGGKEARGETAAVCEAASTLVLCIDPQPSCGPSHCFCFS